MQNLELQTLCHFDHRIVISFKDFRKKEAFQNLRKFLVLGDVGIVRLLALIERYWSISRVLYPFDI